MGGGAKEEEQGKPGTDSGYRSQSHSCLIDATAGYDDGCDTDGYED